jgi:hypothetical protein
VINLKKEKISIIIIFFSIGLALATFSFIPFTGGDNFAYFHLSRALVQGKGYTELWNPNLSLHTKYPPLFPILLLPAAFFNSYLLAKVIVFLCYVFSLFFSYRLFQELNSPKSGDATLIGLLFLALSPVILEYSSWVLSEVPYILVSVLSLYFWSKKKYNTSLFFAILAFLTRTAGITLLITVVVFYFLKFREDKKKIIFPLIAFLSVPFWMIYTSLFKDPSHKSYFQQLIYRNPYNPALGNINALDLIIRVIRNIWAMPSKVFPQIFWGELKNLPFCLSIGIIIFGLAFLGVFGNKIFPIKTQKKAGKNTSIFATTNLMNVYSLLYLLTIWTWPIVWSADKRFYLPILPLVAFWVGKGSILALKKLPENIKTRPLYFVIPGILVVHCIFISLASSGKIWKDNSTWINHGIPPKETTYFQFYINIGKWASGEKVPDNSVFIARKTRAFYHFTKFPASKVPRTQKPQEFKDILERYKVNYIAVFAFFNSKSILLNGMKALENEYEFTTVYLEPDRTGAVFKCKKKL